jgi:hypothetical protein
MALLHTPVDETITTPAGFTITPTADGSYRICDLQRHCLTATSLWEAQQLVQWAEVHHQGLPGQGAPSTVQMVNT